SDARDAAPRGRSGAPQRRRRGTWRVLRRARDARGADLRREREPGVARPRPGGGVGGDRPAARDAPADARGARRGVRAEGRVVRAGERRRAVRAQRPDARHPLDSAGATGDAGARLHHQGAPGRGRDAGAMKAVSLEEVVDYLDTYLHVGTMPDAPNALNGLQVQNSGELTSIVAAVDASQQTIDEVVESCEP